MTCKAAKCKDPEERERLYKLREQLTQNIIELDPKKAAEIQQRLTKTTVYGPCATERRNAFISVLDEVTSVQMSAQNRHKAPPAPASPKPGTSGTQVARINDAKMNDGNTV